MNKERCAWVTDDALYQKYHDEEWGHPRNLNNDAYLFEMLTLEGAQSGLSWLTILKKRETYREAFLNYDLKLISHFSETDIDGLVNNKGVVRHRKKIESVVNNASVFIKVQEEYGDFLSFLKKVIPLNFPVNNQWESIEEVPSETPESKILSKELKKIGFKFIGPVTCYSFMQSVGIVNDHVNNCFLKNKGGKY